MSYSEAAVSALTRELDNTRTELAALRERAEKAERERDEARAELEPRIHSLHIEGGTIEMTLEESTGLVHRMALAMVGMFTGHAATNYLQQEMTVRAREYILTVRPMTRPTPHELRQAADARAAIAEAEVSRLTAGRDARDLRIAEAVREACRNSAWNEEPDFDGPVEFAIKRLDLATIIRGVS